MNQRILSLIFISTWHSNMRESITYETLSTLRTRLDRIATWIITQNSSNEQSRECVQFLLPLVQKNTQAVIQ